MLRFVILQRSGIFLTPEVVSNIIHGFTDGWIIGQHLVSKACRRAERKLLPQTFEEGFRIGKFLHVTAHISDSAKGEAS